MKKQSASLLLMLAAAIGVQAAEALWMRDVKISPDGKQIAFSYKGDIYTVAVAGGNARRLTTLPSYESSPVWSPDSKRIAFASERHGNNDIFIMNADGGRATRLTENSAWETPEAFSPDGKEIYFSAYIQQPVQSAMFPSGRMTQLYTVPAAGGRVRQVLGTPARNIAFTPDGTKMLYHDVKGYEDEWRKHHTSSESRDIWMYDFATGRHSNITNRAGEDRNPVLSPDGKTLFLLSERNGGSFNLWSFPLDNPSNARQLTDFKTHPLRFLSAASNGTMAFTYDGAIYTLASPGAKPVKLSVNVTDDDEPTLNRWRVSPGGAVVSPDGKSVAFVSRGDVFVTSVEHPSTVQVTSTPSPEYHLNWGSDNRTLYYTSERSGHKNIYRAILTRKDDPNFSNATSIKEEPLFDVPAPKALSDTVVEYSHPTLSPDGKKMAYVKNRNHLMVMDMDTRETREYTQGETHPSYNDGMNFVWSPDSRWIAMTMAPVMREIWSDIGLLNVETGVITNLTNSGYFCSNPHFVLDGNAIIYSTDRYGLQAHASWGGQEDIMIMFLNRDARDRFLLSEEDYALLKDAEKEAKNKKSSEPADTAKTSDSAAKEAKKPADDKNIVVELDGIDSRTMRLTPYSSNLSDYEVSTDGANLYYLCALEGGYDLWKLPLRKRDPKMVSKLNTGGSSMQFDKNGKLYIFGSSLMKLDPANDNITYISSNANQDVDMDAERAAMFENMAVEEGARFYVTDMHGVNWKQLTEDYRKFLPHINNNYDLAEMMSEMLGELNVSHTGARYNPYYQSNSDNTATLGLLYDLNHEGNGLKVEEIVVNGPFDRADSKMAPGSVITAINGTPINAENSADKLLNNLAGKKTLVAFTTPDGKEHEEVMTPAGGLGNLMYQRWVRQREEDVRRMSNGRLGYIHITAMDDASFRPLYDALLGKFNNCEGVVIDIRWNGGGWMHEDVEKLLSGHKYLTQVIRGKDVCDMPSQRWNKPSIMVVGEPCYSNAHGTPWVYQHMKLGKIVGMPVPGTMTAVNWVTMQDPSLVYGIPVMGVRTLDGPYLENLQLEPDIKVANDPATIVTGEDRQLRTAVDALLKEIDANKKNRK